MVFPNFTGASTFRNVRIKLEVLTIPGVCVVSDGRERTFDDCGFLVTDRRDKLVGDTKLSTLRCWS